jgi:NADP-dependent 3-hydroxy acid dehydrogenase YdfG
MQLDITDAQSIDSFVSKMDLDDKTNILLNNAGINYEGRIDYMRAKKILDTNFFGTVKFTEKMLPFIKRNGKIIFMGSERTKLRNITNKAVVDTLTRDDTSKEELLDLGHKFLDDVKNGAIEKEGWPDHH